jgi:thioredoxin reductase (NADPH)
MANYEVIIIGGGPAGLTAGLYSARAGLKTVLLERGMVGGQIVNATRIENYPGFPEGISGFDLISLINQQATKYGLEILNAEVTGIKSGKPLTVLTASSNFQPEAVIIAAGSEYSRLGIPGEDKYVGRGISYCATCDGAFFKGREVAVIGGGDTAVSDALELAQHASKIYLIHRREQLRASQILQQRAFTESKLEFIWNSVVEELIGETMISAIKLRNIKTNETSTLPVSGVFVAIGLKPNSLNFINIVNADKTGNIIVEQTMATSVPGIYAAGDIRQGSARQVATAIGDGATAAINAFKYIREQN